MKKTKESQKEEKIIDKILKFTSLEDSEEFKKVASGRKFCKKGERIQDICDEEIEKFEYNNSNSIFKKIFKSRKLKKNKEKLLLENRVSSIIRAIVVEQINNMDELNKEELVLKVKSIILEKVEEYQTDKKES